MYKVFTYLSYSSTSSITSKPRATSITASKILTLFSWRAITQSLRKKTIKTPHSYRMKRVSKPIVGTGNFSPYGAIYIYMKKSLSDHWLRFEKQSFGKTILKPETEDIDTLIQYACILLFIFHLFVLITNNYCTQFYTTIPTYIYSIFVTTSSSSAQRSLFSVPQHI